MLRHLVLLPPDAVDSAIRPQEQLTLAGRGGGVEVAVIVQAIGPQNLQLGSRRQNAHAGMPGDRDQFVARQNDGGIDRFTTTALILNGQALLFLHTPG